MAKPAKAVSKQAAAIALFCGETLLLGKRVERYKGKKVAFGGYWSLFGGAVDEGETPLEGALRELEEETGIKLTEEPTFIRKHMTPNKYNFWIYALSIDYLPSVKLDLSEHTEHGFFVPGHLPAPIDPQMEKTIRAAVDHFQFNR